MGAYRPAGAGWLPVYLKSWAAVLGALVAPPAICCARPRHCWPWAKICPDRTLKCTGSYESLTEPVALSAVHASTLVALIK